MNNFEIAKQYGIAMVNCANKGGIVGLGLVGSDLDLADINLLFDEINKNIPVKFINAKEGSCLMMERL